MQFRNAEKTMQKTKNKRIAICFFGMPPSLCNKHIKVEEDLSERCWHENIINLNSPDIFIHSWCSDDPDKLVEKYRPKLSMFQDNIVFDNIGHRKYDYDDGGGTVKNMFLSQAFSAQQAINLKSQYEKEKCFKYDLVMISRIDCLWLKPQKLDNLNNEYFYVSNWNQARKGKSIIQPLGDRSNFTTENRNFRKILDYWFISNSDNIDTFGRLFEYIPAWLSKNDELTVKISNHSLKTDFLKDSGLWQKVKFYGYEHYDHNIQRYFYQFNDHKRARFSHLTGHRSSLSALKQIFKKN